MHSPAPADSEFAGLLARLDVAFPLTRDSLQFGPHSLEIWRPAQPESILDDEILLQTYEQMRWQPYWAQAWEASFGTCEFLAGLPLSGRRVLDLGCGLGITSALLLAGGATVVAGDNAPPAVEFARLNTWPWRANCRVLPIDWHRTVLDGAFDLIVGSDILYERREIEPLDRFFRRHLTDQGTVLLADPSRPMTREFLQHFARLGWNQETAEVHSERTRLPTRVVTMTLPATTPLEVPD